MQDIEHLTRLITQHPDEPSLYYDRGWAFKDKGELNLAIQDFSRAIELDEYEPDFWLSRGISYRCQGHITLAQRDLDQAIALDVEYPEVYRARAWFHNRNHDTETALVDYNRAVLLDPSDATFRSERGMTLAKLGEYKRGLEDLDLAIRLDPTQALHYYRRAVLRLYHNPSIEPETALPDMNEAIRLDPEERYYRINRGHIHFYCERWADAANDFGDASLWPIGTDKKFFAAIKMWQALSLLFQGKSSESLAILDAFLTWYADGLESRSPRVPPWEIHDWPVPLVCFLAGQIKEEALLDRLSRKALAPGLVPIEIENIESCVMQVNFVVGESLLAQSKSRIACRYLKKACGLSRRNPMSWVAIKDARHVGCM